MGNGVREKLYSGDGSLWWRSEGATGLNLRVSLYYVYNTRLINENGLYYKLNVLTVNKKRVVRIPHFLRCTVLF